MDREKEIFLAFLHEMKTQGLLENDYKDYLSDKNFCKCSKSSVKFRSQGNRLFVKKNHTLEIHEKIWMLYTASIALAVSKSEELAAGYANRSALLMHLRKYDDSLQDIDRALKITSFDCLKVKLLCRKAKCSFLLKNGKHRNSLIKAKYWLNKIKDTAASTKNLVELIRKTEKEMTDNVACCKDENKKCNGQEVQCTNDAVEVYCSEKYGRHLIATRDLKPGEIVLVEKFYAASVNSKKPYAYCSHCLAISWSTIPCDQCAYNMFCNEKCKEEAWKQYHDVECLLDLNFSCFDSFYMQLSIKSLIMGIREAGSVEKLKIMVNNIDKCPDKRTKGFSDGKFLRDSFKSLYSLRYSKKHFEDFMTNIHTLNVLRHLGEKSNILGEDFNWNIGNNLIKNKNVVFVGTLFIRLQEIFFLNAFSVLNSYFGCKSKHDSVVCSLKRCCSRGMSFSPFSSLINHNCDNNVGKCYTNDGKVVYFALYPIKKGSQLFSSYYYCHYARIDKSARHKVLHDLFEFDCDCLPCRRDWPIMKDMMCHLSNAKKSRQYVIGQMSLMKYKKLIINIKRKSCQYDEETIQELVMDIEKLLTCSSNPSFFIFGLVSTLCGLIEKHYGVRLHIPKSCKSSAI